jgi:hypothetical protein
MVWPGALSNDVILLAAGRVESRGRGKAILHTHALLERMPSQQAPCPLSVMRHYSAPEDVTDPGPNSTGDRQRSVSGALLIHAESLGFLLLFWLLLSCSGLPLRSCALLLIRVLFSDE